MQIDRIGFIGMKYRYKVDSIYQYEQYFAVKTPLKMWKISFSYQTFITETEVDLSVTSANLSLL